ncbi:TPR-like protein [Eremomyces bilateralis CBS 781.70]|uniref:TPR-like protein n=1 Tax=Eremomyces bilateralis CBS 781.70 TaxID=1392243 RepID=A0A6G1G8H0_9PEZI|nr:TPR-like protein [Eremomyces bilateralis CBS 781.70]KAF1814367.1 TPR-like protein [Eremomyces bilateralis CBS 781.70]
MATSLNASKKRLALAILDFLSTSATDGTVAQEDAESLEIASNCIAEAFKVDASDKSAVADALGGQSLVGIYGVYEKLKGKSTASTTGASSASEARPATPATSTPTSPPVSTPTAKNDEAERLKGQGNAAMAAKDYPTAIELYTQAIAITPTNPIYLSNRAAAYSGAGRHAEAAGDAELAVAADPKYNKAWSRLGLARFALGDMKGSMEAYGAGIEAEGNGGSAAMKKGFETAKRRYEEEEAGEEDSVDLGASARGGAGSGGMPDLSGLASMLGGGGGGGAGGGMPDFSSIMNNPMMRQMAQNMMSNPDAMNDVLNNPRLRQMAEQFGSGGGQGGGGGMPDLSSLMSDPSIAEMARNFMGGQGGGSGAGDGAGR